MTVPNDLSGQSASNYSCSMLPDLMGNSDILPLILAGDEEALQVVLEGQSVRGKVLTHTLLDLRAMHISARRIVNGVAP